MMAQVIILYLNYKMIHRTLRFENSVSFGGLTYMIMSKKYKFYFKQIN